MRPLLLNFLWFFACAPMALPELVSGSLGACGDGVVQSGEACDDGNDNDFDVSFYLSRSHLPRWFPSQRSLYRGVRL